MTDIFLEANKNQWGPKDSFFSSKLGKGLYTTVGAYEDPQNGQSAKAAAWNQTGNVEFFKEKYKNWNPVVKRLTELTPNVRIFPNYAGPVLPTWLPGPRVALLGDAAHTHGGAFAAGGSLALDDAFALGLALRQVSESISGNSQLKLADIQRGLTLYDRTRRPHAAKLLNIVQTSLHKKQPVYDSPEAEDEALIMRLKSRPDLTWLSEHNVEAEFTRTVKKFDDDKANSNIEEPTRMSPRNKSRL